MHQSGGDWHWIDEAYPADTISLRSVTSDNFVVIDTTGEDLVFTIVPDPTEQYENRGS